MTEHQENLPKNPWGEDEPVKKNAFSKKWLVYTAAILILLLVSWLIARGRGFAWGLPLKTNARHLSDGFFVVGIFVSGVGLLTWTSSTGFFDIFSYAFRSFLVLFTPFVKPEKFPKFYDYKTMKAENRKKPLRSILFIGLLFLVLAALSLWVYRA